MHRYKLVKKTGPDMKIIKNWLLVSVYLLSGCASQDTTQAIDFSASSLNNSAARSHQKQLAVFDRPAVQSVKGKSKRAIKRALYKQYRNWKRVRYKIGGMSKRGIDCSGFVYLTYLNQFGIVLPSNTYEQHKLGELVARRDLRPGDLVFFKTDDKSNHVGMYLKRGRFLHASSSNGVTISYLSDSYWRNRYWKSKRIIGFQ